jgi:hypothetical protein
MGKPSEEWLAFGRRVDAHLTLIDQELAALRLTMRAAGIRVHVQRIRITRQNDRAKDALRLLREQPEEAWRPAEVATHLGISPEYAYDLLAALVAEGSAQRVGRGLYRVIEEK